MKFDKKRKILLLFVILGIFMIAFGSMRVISSLRRSKLMKAVDEIDDQMGSNQSVGCSFEAEVLELIPLEGTMLDPSSLKGYFMDIDPNWKLTLRVLPHQKKIPFQPGIRECYIKDPLLVFGSMPEHVTGVYHFSYVWNIKVPDKPQFSNFKATKIK